MEEDNSTPQPGDLIEIDGTFYRHWALYIGDGYVIHLVPIGIGTPSIFSEKAIVMKQLLKDVVDNRKWCVNNKPHLSRKPLPLKDILERAEKWINKVVPYDMVSKNCEHFVTELRYGEAFSDQVRKVVYATVGAVSFICGTLLVVSLPKKKGYK